MAIFLTEDGSHTVVSEQFGVTYHSIHGAIQESQHIFIDVGLKQVMKQNLPKISILEMGFGTGLNVLMTFLEAEKQGLKVYYCTYEKYPLSIEEAQMLNYEKLLNVSTDVFQKIHACAWGVPYELSPNFVFEKRLDDFENIDLKNAYNLIYFDAFAPEIQPQLWSENIMQRMYDSLQRQGILTTYCAKGIFKRILKNVGFVVQPLPGPPHKREITRCVK